MAGKEPADVPDDEQFPDVIRIEVLAPYREDTLARFVRAGLRPEIERSSSGNPIFVFRGLSEEDAFRVVSLVPREYFAHRGYVGSWQWE
jgi:hypothetical protein